MFPKDKRLARGDFAGATKGRRLSSPNFSVVIPLREEGYAVVVSKKAAALSNKRHLIKRRTLSALRSLTLPPSLIVFPKASALPLSTREIREELEALLHKVR